MSSYEDGFEHTSEKRGVSEERQVKAWIDDGGVLLCASAMCFACHREGKCVPMVLVEPGTIQVLTAQLAEAARYATSLAVYLRDKFYPEVTQWQPLNDLLGVLSQIDNMIAGLVKPTSSDALARYKAMEKVVKAVTAYREAKEEYTAEALEDEPSLWVELTSAEARADKALAKLQEVPHDPAD
jgi:hypothetical protein